MTLILLLALLVTAVWAASALRGAPRASRDTTGDWSRAVRALESVGSTPRGAAGRPARGRPRRPARQHRSRRPSATAHAASGRGRPSR